MMRNPILDIVVKKVIGKNMARDSLDKVIELIIKQL